MTIQGMPSGQIVEELQDVTRQIERLRRRMKYEEGQMHTEEMVSLNRRSEQLVEEVLKRMAW